MGAMPTISLAIPTYNRDRVLVETIEQVLQQRELLKEILVIDQSEQHDEATERYLGEKADAGEIRHIKQFPPNLPAARNRALQECTSDVLIFIDDDVILSDNFIASHLRNYMDGNVTAVAGRVTQRLGWPPVKQPATWRRCLDYRYFNLDSGNRVEGIVHFAGGNHSIRVTKALLLGGYDPAYKGTGMREETDMVLRLYAAGEKIVYDPTSALFHLATASGGCRKKSIWDDRAGKGMIYFAVKHAQTLKVDVIYDLWRALRIMVLNKECVRNPMLLFFKTVIFFWALLSYTVMLSRKSISDRLAGRIGSISIW